jgi:undecaprenyl-diphosphatase
MKKGLIFLILLVILNLFLFFIDVFLVKLFESFRNLIFDYFFISIAFATNIIVVFLFLTVVFLKKEERRRWVIVLWSTAALSGIVSFIIKIIVRRPRPFQEGHVEILRIILRFIENNFMVWNFSFPSFQSVLVFSALPLICKEFNKYCWVWFVFAFLTAISRVYFGAHYLSDVLAGGLIGYGLGIIVLKIEERYNIGKRIMNKIRY